MDRKKILYVITKSVWGGAQRYVFDLATNLPKDKFDIAVITSGNGPLIEKLNIAGIQTIILPTLQNKNGLFGILFSLVNFNSLFQLFKIFKNKRPDVIHLNSSKIGGLGAVAARFSSLITRHSSLVVFTVHGWGFKEDRSRLSRAIIFFFSFISTIFQNKIILINKSDLKSAKKFIPTKKLALIYNGIEKIDFITREKTRRNLKIKEKDMVIGAIAELTKNKGLTYLIKAVGMINAELQMLNAKFIIIGEGENKNKLQNQINILGLQNEIQLTGFIPDAEKLLKAFDIFILPSVKEGLPYAIAAAMQAGLPNKTTNVGCIPDKIEHEKSGLLVESKNPKVLAKTTLELIKNEKKRAMLGFEAAKNAETKFKLRDMVEKTVELYHQNDKL